MYVFNVIQLRNGYYRKLNQIRGEMKFLDRSPGHLQIFRKSRSFFKMLTPLISAAYKLMYRLYLLAKLKYFYILIEGDMKQERLLQSHPALHLKRANDFLQDKVIDTMFECFNEFIYQFFNPNTLSLRLSLSKMFKQFSLHSFESLKLRPWNFQCKDTISLFELIQLSNLSRKIFLYDIPQDASFTVLIALACNVIPCCPFLAICAPNQQSRQFFTSIIFSLFPPNSFSLLQIGVLQRLISLVASLSCKTAKLLLPKTLSKRLITLVSSSAQDWGTVSLSPSYCTRSFQYCYRFSHLYYLPVSFDYFAMIKIQVN